LRDGKAGSQSQVQHIFDCQGRACGSKNFSKEELSTLVQMVDKFKPAGRDQWYKLALQLCARGRELNLGWKLRDGQTCRNRFDKLIPNKKPTGSTEVPDVVLEAM
jgi:hypothetical protein